MLSFLQLHYASDTNAASHYQRPRSRTPSGSSLLVEKRDGSFQTLLTIAPTQDIESTRQIFMHESTPSPLSTGSSTNNGHRHHHHHRKHKSRSNGSHIATRDVGLQVSIQTVRKITFASQKSDETSLNTSTSPPSSSPLMPAAHRQVRTVETNTDPTIPKTYDRSTSYENDVHLVTSSSQTLDSPDVSTAPANHERQTKAAQTSNKTLRDQSIETNHRGIFVCDLSSLLKSNVDDRSPTSSSSKRTA